MRQGEEKNLEKNVEIENSDEENLEGMNLEKEKYGQVLKFICSAFF